MTREEFKVIAKGMKAVFTQPSFIPDADAFDVWYGLLSDLPYDIAKTAVQAYMMQNKSVPTIADIREIALNMQSDNVENDTEAWDIVYKAICNSTYNSAAEFEKLPPMIQKAVGSSNQLRSWAIDEDFNAGVESSNFKKVYRQVQEKEKKKAQLSVDMNNRINAITQSAVACLEGKK